LKAVFGHTALVLFLDLHDTVSTLNPSCTILYLDDTTFTFAVSFRGRPFTQKHKRPTTKPRS
jgi:hypothetical protein